MLPQAHPPLFPAVGLLLQEQGLAHVRVQVGTRGAALQPGRVRGGPGRGAVAVPGGCVGEIRQVDAHEEAHTLFYLGGRRLAPCRLCIQWPSVLTSEARRCCHPRPPATRDQSCSQHQEGSLLLAPGLAVCGWCGPQAGQAQGPRTSDATHLGSRCADQPGWLLWQKPSDSPSLFLEPSRCSGSPPLTPLAGCQLVVGHPGAWACSVVVGRAR